MTKKVFYSRDEFIDCLCEVLQYINMNVKGAVKLSILIYNKMLYFDFIESYTGIFYIVKNKMDGKFYVIDMTDENNIDHIAKVYDINNISVVVLLQKHKYTICSSVLKHIDTMENN